MPLDPDLAGRGVAGVDQWGLGSVEPSRPFSEGAGSPGPTRAAKTVACVCSKRHMKVVIGFASLPPHPCALESKSSEAAARLLHDHTGNYAEAPMPEILHWG
jgi:hypothetical protein